MRCSNVQNSVQGDRCVPMKKREGRGWPSSPPHPGRRASLPVMTAAPIHFERLPWERTARLLRAMGRVLLDSDKTNEIIVAEEIAAVVRGVEPSVLWTPVEPHRVA